MNINEIGVYVSRFYEIVKKYKMHILYTILQIIVIIWYLNLKRPSDSLSNIENGIIKLSQGQDSIRKDIKTIKSKIITMVKKDSTMDNQLQHYPATLPLAKSDITRASSTYSERISPFTGIKEFHWGVDYPARKGTPVYATASGIITKAEIEDNYGNMVKIDHLNRYESLYGHLDNINVKPNQEVKRGDIIGTVGNTGKTTGYHLHYEITYTDSLTKIEKRINPNIFRTPIKNMSNVDFSGLFDYRKFMSVLNYF